MIFYLNKNIKIWKIKNIIQKKKNIIRKNINKFIIW